MNEYIKTHYPKNYLHFENKNYQNIKYYDIML